MRWLELKLPPPIVAGLIAGAMWWGASYLPLMSPPPLVRQGLVLLLAMAGVTCDLLGLLAFLRLRTTVNPLQPQKTSALATGGIYRITRNPMYLGLALLLTAWAVHLASPAVLLGPLAFIAYINRFQIKPEEKVLAGMFGEEYSRYAARVRRWL